MKLGKHRMEGLPFGGSQELLGGALWVPLAKYHWYRLRADPDEAELGMDRPRRPRLGRARQPQREDIPQIGACVGERDSITHEKRPLCVIHIEIIPVLAPPA